MPDDESLPLGLSMLWESTDPRTALNSRFGFSDSAEVVPWLSAVLAQHWGLQLGEVDRLVISDHNAIAWARTIEAGAVVVKWTAEVELFARLRATTEIIAELGSTGIPVATPLNTREGVVRGIVDGPHLPDGSTTPMSMAVLPEVTGTWLDPDDLTTVHQAGAVLARLHSALSALAPDPVAFPRPEVGLREKIIGWVASADPALAPELVARLVDLVDAAPETPDDLQLIHRDFRAANILVDGTRIAAVLDFDDVVVGLPLTDLAQASILLATRFRDWGPTTQDTRRALRAGYESVRPLDAAETAWLEIAQLWLGIALAPSPTDVPAWTATH